jgi:hypothetical protein
LVLVCAQRSPIVSLTQIPNYLWLQVAPTYLRGERDAPCPVSGTPIRAVSDPARHPQWLVFYALGLRQSPPAPNPPPRHGPARFSRSRRPFVPHHLRLRRPPPPSGRTLLAKGRQGFVLRRANGADVGAAGRCRLQATVFAVPNWCPPGLKHVV